MNIITCIDVADYSITPNGKPLSAKRLISRDPTTAAAPKPELREDAVEPFKHRAQHILRKAFVVAHRPSAAYFHFVRYTVALLLPTLVACEAAPPPPPSNPVFESPAPELKPFIPTSAKVLRDSEPKGAAPTALMAPTFIGAADTTGLEKRSIEVRGGVYVGDPDTIDAIDDAFVGRMDILALVPDSKLDGWFRGKQLVVARATVGNKSFLIGRYEPRAAFFDFDGMGMDGVFRARPVRGSKVTSRYGLRFHPVDKVSKVHRGTDYGAPTGTPVYATAAGKVVTLAQDDSAGLHIKLQHESGETLYLHLSETALGLRRDDIVAAGQMIGKVGTTGKSTGPHLHYELRYGGVAVDSVATIPRGLSALGLSEKSAHQATLRRITEGEQ